MGRLAFIQLNDGWNAYPNGSESFVSVNGDELAFEFALNPFVFPDVAEGDAGVLKFGRCTRWRLGSTNDEGWYRGQCRYSRSAPAWGEFYELLGDDPERLSPTDWHVIGPDSLTGRHFLFYLREETFECLATDWSYARKTGEQA